MDARDICAIGDALAEGLDTTATRVEEIHHAIAERSFAVAGPARKLPQRLHDLVAAGIYSTVRTIGPAAVRSGALGLGAAVDPESLRVHSSPRGKTIVSAVNGVFGDALARRRNGLALPMALRAGGHDVRPTAEALARAFPNASTRVAVFVHGLGDTDDSWRRFAQANWGDPGASYGELLRRERGYTPLYIHYNSGLGVTDNAAQLSALLEAVYDGWPRALHQIVLVGHSAGALVARAAIRDGVASGARWARSTDHAFSLGAPATAIRVEKATQSAGRALSRLPETRPLARLLDARSAGLKDLDGAAEPPLPAWIQDVRLPAKGVRVPHFRLLNHPVIYEQLRARLSDHTVPGRARVARGGRYGQAARALRSRRPSRRR
jgi:pimeloyl-ACP methyl ester carboxylesterase